MRYLFSFLICIGSLYSNGQNNLGIDIVSNLPRAQVYFVGQLHNNEANAIIEEALLLSLHTKYDVQYQLLEYAHSAAFLINRYLQTGDEDLLKFIHADAKFNFIKSIKAYNNNLSAHKQIRFYGVDFENRQNGKYTQKALAIILDQLKPPTSNSLALLLSDIVTAQPTDLEKGLIRLKSYIQENDSISRVLLGKYYLDVLLMANAQFNFSPRRDASMVSNFFRMYDELAKEGRDPKFFASFGIGHINPRNKNGIAMKLMLDHQSPVQNNVCVLGVQYFNCLFSKENVHKETDGSLNALCKKTTVEKLSSLQDNSKRIEFLSKPKLGLAYCDDAIQLLSGMILVYNYGSTSFGFWE